MRKTLATSAIIVTALGGCLEDGPKWCELELALPADKAILKQENCTDEQIKKDCAYFESLKVKAADGDVDAQTQLTEKVTLFKSREEVLDFKFGEWLTDDVKATTADSAKTEETTSSINMVSGTAAIIAFVTMIVQ